MIHHQHSLLAVTPLRHEVRFIALMEEDHAVQFVTVDHGPAPAVDIFRRWVILRATQQGLAWAN